MKSLLLIVMTAVIICCNNPSNNKAVTPSANTGSDQTSAGVKENLPDTNKESANPVIRNNIPPGGEGTTPGSNKTPAKNPNSKGALDDTAQEIHSGATPSNNNGTKTGSATIYDSNNKGGLSDTAQENRNQPNPLNNVKPAAQKINVIKYSNTKGGLSDTAMERSKPLIKPAIKN